ncbi:MAG: DMT family transporter [Acidimicrobiales bacterium]
MTALDDPTREPSRAVPVPASDREPFAPLDWALFAAVSGIWGASFLFIAIGLEHFHPGFITLARVGLGAAALAVLPGARTRIARVDRPLLVAISVIWVGVPFTLFPLAEEHINSAVTGLLNGATPFFAGLFAALFFNRTPRGPQRVGMVVGFGGITLVSFGSAVDGGSAIVGVVMVLAATICYGLATNLAGPLQQKYGSVALMSKVLAVATVLTAPFGIWGLARSDFGWDAAAATTVLGVFGTGIAFALMATLVGRVGGPRASFITYLIPVVSLVLGAVFRDDEVSALALLGVVLVLGGALLAARREH